jgi:hypothetical protein
MYNLNKPAARIAAAGVLLFALAIPAVAADRAVGKLVVNGKTIPITHAYAFAKVDAFEETPLTVVVLCDAPLSTEAVRDRFERERREQVGAGKLNCVQQRINAEKQVINFGVRSLAFGTMQPDGGSTEHVFEAGTFDGKTIAGHAYTRSPQISFDDVPYSYDITFSANIEPAR